MKNYISWVAGVLAVIALVLSIGNAVGGNQPPVPPQTKASFGDTNYGYLGSRYLSVGSGCNDSNSTCAATKIGGLVASICNLIGTEGSQAATSTKAYDCTVTNLTSSFNTLAQLATSTISTIGGWVIASSKASTTAGFATVMLTNLTGAAAVPAVTGVGSSTVIWAFQ